MNLKILLTLFFLWIFGLYNQIIGQSNMNDANLLLNKGYVAHNVFNPHMGNKGFEAVEPWKGFEVKSGKFVFEYIDGYLREQGVDSTVANVSGRMYRIGMQFGKKFKLGYHSLFSAYIEPFCRIQAGYAEMPNKVVNNRVASAGLVISPGVAFKLSQFYFTTSYNGGGYLNTALTGGNKEHNIFPGFMGGYTFSFGVDTNIDVLAPREFTASGLNVYKRTTVESKDKVEYENGSYKKYREITTRVYTKYSKGNRSLNLVKSFWGIGPTYSYAARRGRQASTKMYGVNLGARFNMVSVDAFYEEGSIGTEDQVGKDPILINYPQLRNYDFSSQVMTRQYGGRIGINLTKFFALNVNFVQDGYSKKQTKNAVTYGRLNVFFTGGMANFLGEPEYTYPDGSSRLENIQNIEGIEPSAENNPDFLPDSSPFIGWGGSIELGSAFIKMTNYRYLDAPIADHLQYTVGTNIPIHRLANSIAARFFL